MGSRARARTVTAFRRTAGAGRSAQRRLGFAVKMALPPLKKGGSGPALAPLGAKPADTVSPEAKAAFEKIDTDKSVFLDKEEIYKSMEDLCDTTNAEAYLAYTTFIDQQFQQADTGLAGKLNVTQFSKIY